MVNLNMIVLAGTSDTSGIKLRDYTTMECVPHYVQIIGSQDFKYLIKQSLHKKPT